MKKGRFGPIGHQRFVSMTTIYSVAMPGTRGRSPFPVLLAHLLDLQRHLSEANSHRRDLNGHLTLRNRLSRFRSASMNLKSLGFKRGSRRHKLVMI
jgi:hypothetical protein